MTRQPRSDRKTHEEFVKEVFNKFGEEYLVVSNYIDSISEVEIKHLVCGNTLKKLPSNFMRSKGCNFCSGYKKKTHKEFIEELRIVHQGNITMLSTYETKRKIGKFKCNICEFEWEASCGGLIRTNPSKCPNCSTKKRNSKTAIKKVNNTKAIFKSRIYDIYGDLYEVLSDYEHHRKKLKLRCKLHDVFYQRYDMLLSGIGCQECGKESQIKNINASNDKKRHIYSEEFKVYVENECKEYELLSEYINVNTYITMKHLDCGHIWEVTPANFRWNERRCPNCASSKGEKKIIEFLNIYHLKYDKEVFMGRSKKRFDFKIEKTIYLEYDGEDHFLPIDRAGKGEEWAMKNHLRRIKSDNIKNQYCIDNNIPLIRIPYWEFGNIEYILDNTLHHFDIKKLHNENTYDQEIVKRYLVDSNWNHDTYISWQHKENRYWLDELVHN